MGKVSGVSDIAKDFAASRGISVSEARSIINDLVPVLATKIVEGGVSFKGVFTITPKLRKGRQGKVAFGENKGKEWKSEDKLVLNIKTGSQMDKELNG